MRLLVKFYKIFLTIFDLSFTVAFPGVVSIPPLSSPEGLLGHDVAALGIPSEQELISLYCKLTGTPAIDNWSFYAAFCFFRAAAILQGVYKRSLQSEKDK